MLVGEPISKEEVSVELRRRNYRMATEVAPIIPPVEPEIPPVEPIIPPVEPEIPPEPPIKPEIPVHHVVPDIHIPAALEPPPSRWKVLAVIGGALALLFLFDEEGW